MDKFQEVRVFAAVVDAGSFVGCSAALDMSGRNLQGEALGRLNRSGPAGPA